LEEFQFALKRYLLISLAYFFIGITFGLLMKEAGYGTIWSFLSALFIYGGTIQLLLVGILKNHTPILTIGLISLLVNSRHMFYGLTYIDEFKKIRKKSFLKFLYLSLTLTDEVYSLYIGSKFPERLNRTKIMLWINALSYFTWIFGCTMGGILYNFINNAVDLITLNNSYASNSMNCIMNSVYKETELIQKTLTYLDKKINKFTDKAKRVGGDVMFNLTNDYVKAQQERMQDFDDPIN